MRARCRQPQVGITTAWLEVSGGNAAAIKLYQNLGFEEAGTRRGYYSDGSDALIMRKHLGPLPATPAEVAALPATDPAVCG